jgi:hypothetical protein
VICRPALLTPAGFFLFESLRIAGWFARRRAAVDGGPNLMATPRAPDRHTSRELSEWKARAGSAGLARTELPGSLARRPSEPSRLSVIPVWKHAWSVDEFMKPHQQLARPWTQLLSALPLKADMT